MAEEEQFAKDVARAIELSRITASEDEDRRQRLGILPLSGPDYGNGRSMPNSRSSPSIMKNGGNSESIKISRSPEPSPTPLSNLGSSDSSAGKDGLVVRARPRPSSGRTSPASRSTRRSGFIESNENDRLTLPSSRSTSPWDTPRDTLPGNGPITSEIVAKRDHTTLWEQFEADGTNPSSNSTETSTGSTDPFDSITIIGTNPFDSTTDTDATTGTTTGTSSDPFNTNTSVFSAAVADPFALEGSLLQNLPGRRDRADSATNLIALSPMNKVNISKHFNIDLDSLFAGGPAAGSATTGTINGSALSRPPSLNSSANQMPPSFNSANQRPSFNSANQQGSSHYLANQENVSASWSSGSNSLSLDQSVPKPSSPAAMSLHQHVPGATVLQPTTLQKSNTFPQQSTTVTNTPFDINDFFGDFLTTRTADQSPPMPTSRPPTLPLPPPVPARTSVNSQPMPKKTSLHIKKVTTSNSDLLDLGGDLKMPEVSSVQLFDPLFSASDQDKKGLEEQFTDLSTRLTARLAYTLTDCEDDLGVEAQLQDPFSYEELSMTLMESSRIKGDDVVLIEEMLEEEEISEEATVYESIPSTPEGDPALIDATRPPQRPPQRPPKPRSLSVSSPKYLKIPDNETMDEFTAFSVAVARLKADYKYDDKYTNLGILFSPTVNIPAAQGLTVDIIVYTEMASEPIEFNLNVSTSVEIIIWNVMSRISCDFLELSVDDYILKVFSYSEFLVNDSILSDYAYTHNCLKLNERLRFSLHVVASLHKPFLRKPGDDDEPIYMIKGELHGDKSYKVQPKDLKLLNDVFCKQHEAVNKTALESGLAKLGVTTMLQSVKAITWVLLGAETLEVKTAVEHLKGTLNEIDNSIYDERKFIELMDDFQNAMENLCTGVKNLITMYCATFHVTYSPSGLPSKRREIKEVTDSLENILVHVGSVHRIPANIRGRFDHFKVIVSLYYAGRKVTDHTNTDVYSTLDHPASTDTIYFDQWLELTNFPMCLVPLETRVLFTLCAMNTAQPVGGSGANVLNKWNNIGWVSFMLFDFKR